MATQIGKVYAVKCPDDSRYYKTILVSRNPFTGNLESKISNPVYGEIPPDMPIMPELMSTRLMSMNNALPFNT